MKTKTSFRRKSATVTNSRWAAYAAAGAATAVAGTHSAEADITYSGLINRHLDASAGEVSRAFFQLDQPGNSIYARHVRSEYEGPIGGSAVFFAFPTVVSGAVAGIGVGGSYYASKLAFGQIISTRPFIRAGFGGGLALYYGYPNSQWVEPGIGFAGFRFNGGTGVQYGWARISMDGAPENSFTLIDYAFGDVGDRITAGQTAVPDSGGSLGLMAIGCAGLLAWRARRSDAAQSAA